MHKPEFHFLLCASFRTGGEPMGVCHKKGATDLLQYLQSEISDRGLDATISTTGCFSVCEKGPVMVIYPQAWWYGEVNEEKIDTILDALADGQSVEELLLT